MKFIISAVTGSFGELVRSVNEKDPEQAILRWCEFSEKYPTCVSIQPETKEDGLNLLKWAKLNFEKVETYLNRYRCPYRTDWLKTQIFCQVNNNKTSMQWEYDQLFPFCVG